MTSYTNNKVGGGLQTPSYGVPVISPELQFLILSRRTFICQVLRHRPQKIFGTMPFQSKENAEKNTFILLLKRVGDRPPGPP